MRLHDLQFRSLGQLGVESRPLDLLTVSTILIQAVIVVVLLAMDFWNCRVGIE